MSYVFSKALMQKDDQTKQQKLPLILPNKIPPPVAIKPESRKSSQQPPPAVKRKPLTKSYSVDSGSAHKQERSGSVDLTVLGGSEWKDFVLKRQREREAREAEEEAKRHDEADGSRRSSTSSSTSCSTSCSVDGGDDASIEPRGRTHSSSSYTREGVPDERREFRRTLSTSGRARIPSLDLTQVGNDEWKRISARKEKERLEAEKKEQEKEAEGQVDVPPADDITEVKDVVPKIVDGEWKKVESLEKEEVTQKIVITGKLSDSKEEVVTSKIVNGEWTKVAEDKDEEVEISQIVTTTDRKKPKEDPTPVKTTELQPVPEQTVMMDNKKSSPAVPPVTLPKPRKIGAELKRHSFAARTSNSSISKSFAVGDSVPVIKRSSDMMNATKKEARNERSLSFDTQTPYFCRLPRALSIELEETLTQCELSLKTPRSASVSSASSGDVFETNHPISPTSSLSEVNEDISLIEASPDVIAMKNEIAVERSKKELERKTLSDTIDEIDSFELELDNLIKPKDGNVFVESSGPVSTSEVIVLEESPASPPATLNQSIEETQLGGPKSEPSDETIDLLKEKVDLSDKQSEPPEAGTEETGLIKSEKEPISLNITDSPCEDGFIGPVSVSGSTDLATDGPSSEPISTSEEKVPEELTVSSPVNLDQSTVETQLDGPKSVPYEETIDLSVEKVDHCDKRQESPDAGTGETDQVKLEKEPCSVSITDLPGEDNSNIESEQQENDTEATPDVFPETNIPKTENEGVNMTVEEFSSMINESDAKHGINEPVISVSEKDHSELSVNKSDSSVNTQIENAINDIVPPVNVEAKGVCASNHNQDGQQEPDYEISLEQKPAESSEVEQACTVPSVAPLENVIGDLKLCDTKETNGAVIVDTDEKPPSPSLSEPETSDNKNESDIPPVKSADMNKELVDNYVSIEHNGVLNGNQMETNDIKLLSEKGFNDRVIFV